MNTALKTLLAGFALAAASAGTSSAAIGSSADCEYEGGEIFTVAEGTVCMVPIREAQYEGEAYDGQQLGVSECEGTKMNNDQWCKIVLVAAPAKPETPMPAQDMSMDDMETADEE